MRKPRVVFFGNEKLSTGLVTTRPLIREAVEAAGFEIEQVVAGPLSELKPHESKLAVLAAYGHVIPQEVLDGFPLGIINVHPSLLPVYRGSTPIESAILDGATKTGVSIMRLTVAMDEGPIYKQKAVYLTGKETKTELSETLQKLGAELLVEVLPAIADGSLAPRQQPHPDRDALYCKKLSKEDGRIDWTKPRTQIEREIRAYAGWPRSYTKLGAVEVVITQAHSVKSTSEKPGTVEVEDELKLLMVYASDGYICIDKLIPAGKKEMSASAFLAGYKDRLNAQAA